jgi:D-methionine transport system substrate-binding protein
MYCIGVSMDHLLSIEIKQIFMLINIFFFCVFLSGCKGCVSNQNMEAIKLGVMSAPEAELIKTVQEVAKEEQNLDIKIVEFNDYMTPNIALNDESIDANMFQHEPYLKQMVKDRGFNIISIAKTFIFPLAAYSKKITRLEDLPKNAKIAIPNDPTNEARALLLLQEQGLIKLKDKDNTLSQIKDIVENSYNFSFVALDAAQLPRALDDVSLAIINTTFAKAAGLDSEKDGLFREGKDSLYVNIIAIRAEDKDKPWVNKLIKSVQHWRVTKAAQDIFDGAVLMGFDDGQSYD